MVTPALHIVPAKVPLFSTALAALFVHHNTMEQDNSDFLEPSVLLDETQYQEGYRDGYADGWTSGKEEGRRLGLNMVCEELVFYRGCLDVWTSVARMDRMKMNIKQMAALVSSYPVYDPEDEQVQDIMGKMRLKFRVITASLGAKLGYEGRSKPPNQGFEDL